MNKYIQKPILSPILGVLFLVISVTGLLMFFHLANHAVKELHEMTGILLVVTGLLHMLLHLKGLTGYLKQRKGQFAIVGAVALVVVLAFAAFGEQGEQHGHGPNAAQHQE